MAVKVTSKNNDHTFPALSLEQVSFKCSNNGNNRNGIRRLYHADNLYVLKHLLEDQQICGKIQLIYIDPPYNTGGAFETRDLDYAYNDKFSIQDYLDFMRERLTLMHTLMSPTGSIYVHLDSNMVFHVKLLMDDIFGEKNFKGMITRKKCKSKNSTKKTYGNISDYILYYIKGEQAIWNRPYEEWTDEKILKEYPFIEEGTGRRHKRVPCHAPGVRNGDTGKPWRGLMPPKGKHWQYTPEKLDELDRNGEIYWSSNGNPRRKVYLDQSKGIPVQDIWLDFLDVNNQNSLTTGYPTEKNLDMLKRLIEASSQPNDIVLDCFAGSGSTLVAAEALGRQWIGVDIGNKAIETIQHRFTYGTTTIKAYDKATRHNKLMSHDLFDEPTPERENLIYTEEKARASYELFTIEEEPRFNS